jgi:hypothetical protein
VSIFSGVGTSSFTLTAGGTVQIDQLATVTVNASTSGSLIFDGTKYRPFGVNGFVANAFSSITQTFNGTVSLQGRFRTRVQQFSGAGSILSTSGPHIEKTASGAYTLALPTSPSTGDTYWVFDGFGDAGTNNLSLSSSSVAINSTAAGGEAVVAVSTNWGRGTVTYDGTAWKLAKG